MSIFNYFHTPYQTGMYVPLLLLLLLCTAVITVAVSVQPFGVAGAVVDLFTHSPLLFVSVQIGFVLSTQNRSDPADQV